MERTVIIDAQVNTGNSVEDLEKVAQGFDDVADASSKSNTQTQKQFDDLNKKVEKGGLSVRDYSKAIKEYTSIALAAGRTSPIGVEALNRAAQMKDELGDLKNEVTRLGADGRKLQASLQLGGTVVAGYQAFTGVTAMLGVENEGLLKTMTMLQAAQGTLQAIETVRLALEKESILMIELRNAKTKVGTALQWLFNAAMAANPIGLVVAGIVALGAGIAWLGSKLGIFTAAWDGIKSAVSSVVDMFSNFIGFMGGLVEKIKGFGVAARVALAVMSGGMSELIPLIGKAIDHYRGLAEAQSKGAAIAEVAAKKRRDQLLDELGNLNRIEKASKDKFDAEIQGLDFAIRKAQASGKDYVDLERKKLEATIARIREEIIFEQKKSEVLAQIEEDFANQWGVFGEQMKKNNEENIAKRKAKQEELAASLKKTEEDLVVFEIGVQKKSSDAYAKSQEEKTAKLKEEGEKRKELQKQLEDQIAANIKDADERAITQLQLKHQREREELIAKYGKDSALLGNLERIQAGEKNKLLDEIEAGDAEEKAKRDKDETDANKVHTDQLLTDLETEKNKKKELEDKEVADKKATQEAIFGVSQAAINGLKSIGEMAIKDQKKAQQFSAVMTASQMALDSAKAITGAVAATAGVPFPANIPAIATAVAAVLGNIATAVKAFKQAKVGSAPSVSTPSASGVGASSNASENEVVRRGANGETFTGEQPALTRPPMARVAVLNSELQMVRQEQEAIVEQSTL
jgi:hypothetical protein